MHHLLCKPSHPGSRIALLETAPEIVALQNQGAVLRRVLEVAVFVNKTQTWPSRYADHVSFGRDEEPSFRSWHRLEENNAKIQESITSWGSFMHPEVTSQGEHFNLGGFVFWDEGRWEYLAPAESGPESQDVAGEWPDMDTLIVETLIFEDVLSSISSPGAQVE